MDLAKLQQLVQQLREADTLDKVHAACCELCQSQGFDTFLFAAKFPTSFVDPHIVIISAYPEQWRREYDANDFRQVDPTVHHCLQSVLPLNWEDAVPPAQPPEPVRRFVEASRDYGLHSGLSVPIHTPYGESGMISLASSRALHKSQPEVQRAQLAVQFLLPYVFEAVRAVVLHTQESVPPVNLTARERECLCWAAEGKTTWEIGQILGVTERTVHFHIQNVLQKLNVINRQQAVARAVALGVISTNL